MLRTLNKSQVFARVRRLEYIERENILVYVIFRRYNTERKDD